MLHARLAIENPGGNSMTREESVSDKGVRNRLLLEIGVLLSVLEVPSLLGQLVGLTARRSSAELLAYRCFTESSHLLLILYIVLVLRREVPMPRPKFDVKWDIALGVLLFCVAKVVWSLTGFISTGHAFSLGITAGAWTSPLWVLGLLALTMVLTALYQEIFMRWYLISRLEQVGLATWMAVLGSSILFGIWHLYEGQLGVIHTLSDGLLYGACFAMTRRIGPVVVAHFLWNFIIFLQMGHI